MEAATKSMFHGVRLVDMNVDDLLVTMAAIKTGETLVPIPEDFEPVDSFDDSTHYERITFVQPQQQFNQTHDND